MNYYSVMFAVIFEAQEAVNDIGQVVTREGQELVVTNAEWVEASSRRITGNRLPVDTKIFDSREKAHRFMVDWKGHPWDSVPKRYRLVLVKPMFEKLTGYKQL